MNGSRRRPISLIFSLSRGRCVEGWKPFITFVKGSLGVDNTITGLFWHLVVSPISPTILHSEQNLALLHSQHIYHAGTALKQSVAGESQTIQFRQALFGIR
jgi:hypothetical protein